jgi:type IV fimbrial biogenesis protein FimT
MRIDPYASRIDAGRAASARTRSDYPAPRRVHCSEAGFSLIELLTTIAVVGVLAAIAVPNMRPFIQNNRLTSAANDLLRSFQLARTEAIKRQQTVVVCASANPTAAGATCSYGAFTGWIVFQDGDVTTGVAADWQRNGADTIIERHPLLDRTITVKTDNNGIESYAATGFGNPAGAEIPTRNVLICDVRGNLVNGAFSVERAVVIAATGRVRVSKATSDVNTTSAAVGGCP